MLEDFFVGLETFAIGLLLVFFVLFVLVGVLQLFNRITLVFGSRQQEKKETDDSGIDDEILAVITAATAVVMKDNPHQILSIKEKK